ncbi:hypothetical protein AB833_05980 [Chromatiales bacterium (ex Bugula neritina AB1)]|nr:hypothetical protein AB833_05980 [Chromatiales bacterium (ex Bugula neritina AB1)]
MASKPRQQLQSLTREQFWQHHIKSWQDSGTSKMRYCRDNELVYHQLIYWNEKFRQLDESGKDTQSGFVNVSLASAQSQPGAMLSIELPNGICISGVNNETIGLVPQLLRNL